MRQVSTIILFLGLMSKVAFAGEILCNFSLSDNFLGSHHFWKHLASSFKNPSARFISSTQDCSAAKTAMVFHKAVTLPAGNYLVEFMADNRGEVEIYTRTGYLVFSTAHSDEYARKIIGNLAAGTYDIKVTVSDFGGSSGFALSIFDSENVSHLISDDTWTVE